MRIVPRNGKQWEGMLDKSIVTRRLLLGGATGLLAAPAIVRAQENTIRIGFPVPLTGPYGTEAQDQVRCAQLAVAEFNDAGGLNGQKAELLVRDDKLDPGEAATRTLELIERDRVNYIVGSLSASVQLAVNNVPPSNAKSSTTRSANPTRSPRCRTGAAIRSMRG